VKTIKRECILRKSYSGHHAYVNLRLNCKAIFSELNSLSLMKMTIINPSFERDYDFYDLGTAAVATSINASDRHKASVLDFFFVWNEWEEHLREHLKRFKPEIIGLSTYSPRMHQALTVAKLCKEILPDVKVVMGGHHASLDTTETLKQDCVDFVVIGEADNTIVQLLDAIEEGSGSAGYYNVPFLAFKDEGKLVENPLGKLPTPKELDKIPFNDWTLWEHHEKAIYHTGYLPIIGVRGCPYKCSFCSSPIMAERLAGAGPFVRQKSAQRTAHEAAWQWERHKHQGLRYLMFYDQNFLISSKWLEEFCEEYRKLGMHEKLPFSCYSRLDHITKEKLEMARSAGCIQLRVGIESGNEEVRNKLLNKELTQDELIAKVKLLNDSKIGSLGYFIIGSKDESISQANESFTFAKKVKLKRAAFFFLTPLYNIPIQKDVKPNFLEMDRSLGFGFFDGITSEISGVSKLMLILLFYRANGWFLLKNIFVQIRNQGLRFIWGFPRYYKKAKKDGFDFQQSVVQYTYYHGDSFLY